LTWLTRRVEGKRGAVPPKKRSPTFVSNDGWDGGGLWGRSIRGIPPVVVKPCIEPLPGGRLCGALVLAGEGNRCERHRREGSGRSNRDRSARRRLRTALLRRAGERCEHVDRKTGVRCPVTVDLRACHITPLAAGGGYDPADAVLLCRAHDMASDRYAR
jgi:hypothetical protein